MKTYRFVHCLRKAYLWIEAKELPQVGSQWTLLTISKL